MHDPQSSSSKDDQPTEPTNVPLASTAVSFWTSEHDPWPVRWLSWSQATCGHLVIAATTIVFLVGAVVGAGWLVEHLVAYGSTFAGVAGWILHLGWARLRGLVQRSSRGR